MGTETLHRKNRYLNSFQILVKLNNPLMGTETHYFKDYRYIDSQTVKLNNPLMGTETESNHYRYSIFKDRRLN